MNDSGRIVLLGATGYTGRLVAHELAAQPAPYVLAARDPGRLETLAKKVGAPETHLADVTRPADLQRLLHRGDVVINCVGPFSELGEPVVRACIETGAHYLDTTGEQRFMKRIIDRYDDAAREAGVTVVNGMAFEYALGDAAAALATEGLARPLRSVDVTYAWHGGAASSSRGTRKSVLRILGTRGYTYRAGAWREENTGAARRTVRLPGGKLRTAVTFPAGEVLTVPRQVEVGTVRGWVVVGRPLARLVSLASPLLPHLVRLASPLTEQMLRLGPEGPAPEHRQAGTFLIMAEAIGSDGARRCTAVRGRDPYELTAVIAVQGALHLLDGRSAALGVAPPVALLDPAPFLDSLADHGVDWDDSCRDEP